MNSNSPLKTANSEQAVTLIGESLARLRLSRNLSQSTLAREAGISLSTLKRLEHGKNPTLDSLVRVMAALNISENLSLLVPDTDVRPLERAAAKGQERQRARAPKTSRPKSLPWTWDAP